MQVVKDPLGNKGARLTTFITLPSRHLVLLPTSDTVGISARIEDEAERDRLRAIIEELLAEQDIGCGVIVRTVAEGASEKALRADLKFLAKLWEVVQGRCSNAGVKTLVHEDLSLPLRVLRDLVTSDVAISSSIRRRILRRCRNLRDIPARLRPCWSCTSGAGPIFDLHGIEDEIRKVA